MYTESLFSYGTLQYETVQLSTFGRKLHGKADTLTGYKLEQVQIQDPAVIAASGEAVHPILIPTGNLADEVPGTVFDITPAELALADQYEVADYKRAPVQLKSGRQAWVYVSAAHHTSVSV